MPFFRTEDNVIIIRPDVDVTIAAVKREGEEEVHLEFGSVAEKYVRWDLSGEPLKFVGVPSDAVTPVVAIQLDKEHASALLMHLSMALCQLHGWDGKMIDGCEPKEPAEETPAAQ